LDVIITKIIGGLGNQMFQYAAARALSLKNSSSLLLDISEYKKYKLHQGFELNRIFNGSFGLASEKDMYRVLNIYSPSFIRRITAHTRMSIFRPKSLVVEPHFKFWHDVNKLTGSFYLNGSWQSEKYFLEYAEEIREDFKFLLPLDNINAQLAIHINNVNSVSLHVRRGDYVSNKKASSVHGVCSIEYYRSAIEYIAFKIDNPYFFIFSDDIPWVKNNLNIEFPCQYVENNFGIESYNDMRMMSLCRHHIIANSSFSWWGAWLNPRIDKIVIAPKRWFLNQLNIQDVLPDNWVKF
jgi:hypothetical protein